MNSTGSTGVALVRTTRNPRVASSAAVPTCVNIEGTITARRPRVSMRRPPISRTAIAAPAYAV